MADIPAREDRETDRQTVIASACLAMIRAKIEAEFIVDACRVAAVDDEALGYLRGWLAATDADRAKRDLTSEMAEVLFDHLWDEYEKRWAGTDPEAPVVPNHRPWLRELVERHGGVSAVARKAQIPQPSLSRMLSSPSVLRPATRVKLAAVLGIAPETLAGRPRVMKRDGT